MIIIISGVMYMFLKFIADLQGCFILFCISIENLVHDLVNQVSCFAEAGGQHVSGMAKAVELLGIRGCLTQSTMDSGHGLPSNWSNLSTDYCLEVFCNLSAYLGTNHLIN